MTCALVLASQSLAAADHFSLGTATAGGGFPVFGAALAQAVHEVDPSIEIQPRDTAGSFENVRLLASGDIDLGLVQGEVAEQAFACVDPSARKLRIVAAMYTSPGMFVVRADSPYQQIRDLVGKPVAFGTRGSGLVLLARNILAGLNLDPDRDFRAVYLERAADGPTLLQDGRIAALWGAGLGWPSFVAISQQPAGARFIAPDAAECARIVTREGSLRKLTVPADTYAGQITPIETVGSWSFVLAREDWPEELAYRLARALDQAQPALGNSMAAARETTLANTVAAAPSVDRIHPGVLRYLRETGRVK